MTAPAAILGDIGEGRIPPERADQLRSVLLQNFAGYGYDDANLQQEIDDFIKNGRLSNTNLSRLERRINRRFAPDGSQSARGSQAGVSEFTHALPTTPLSARMPFQGGSRGGSEFGAGSQLSDRWNRGSIPQGADDLEVSTWSEVAKHAKLLEQVESKRKKDAIRNAQAIMRKELMDQMEIKKQQQEVMKVEAQRLFERQKLELERFEESEKLKKQDFLKKVVDVNKERDMQTSLTIARKEQEALEKKKEDIKLVKKAALELESEQQLNLEKKHKSKMAMAKLTSEYTTAKGDPKTARQAQIDLERKKVQEFNEMLEQQERNNKQKINPTREGLPGQALVGSPRKAFEFYSEDNIMQLQQDATRKKDLADQQKKANLREARQRNQDFLLQQIEEKKVAKRSGTEYKADQRVIVQEAVDTFKKAEKDRLDKSRAKNVAYRVELEEHIGIRRSAPKDKSDAMSAAEVAINRHLLQDARVMKRQVEEMEEAGQV